MKKVSIIVPTYNVEKYIAKCLDSLVSQDYQNYDVLVINDGSPANEQVIIDAYQEKYPQIIKSIIKENGGYGSVLELGFKTSDADYILVCDPDDYLAPNCLSYLVEESEKNNADLVVGAKYLVYSDNDESIYDKSYNEDFGSLKENHVYYSNRDDFKQLYFLEPSPHAKLYKRSMLLDIKFPHKVSYTDNLLYFGVLTKCRSVVYVSEALSYYLIDRVGNTRTDLKPAVIDAWVKVYLEIISQVKNADSIFYYRMYEAFKVIFYKCDQINTDDNVKKEKMLSVYRILDALLVNRNKIIACAKEYNNYTKMDEKLLNKDTSYQYFKKLVNRRLKGIDGSFKYRMRKAITKFKPFEEIYQIYHEEMKYRIHKNDEPVILNKEVTLSRVGKSQVNFFGYYDKPCIFEGNSLYHVVPSEKLDLNQAIDIYVNDKKVSTTVTWNWQQGAMSTWLDSKHIIHNDYVNNRYVSKIVNIETCDFKVLDLPIYSVSKDKKFALTLNFNRLMKLRPDYGYHNQKEDLTKNSSKDGLFYINLETNDHRLLLSLEEISAFKRKENMVDAWHKINHIDISPDSKHAIFLHRWYVGKVKYTRLLCIDIESLELTLLSDNDMVSHMAWVNGQQLIGYLKGANNVDGYYLVELDGSQSKLQIPELVDDGHPTIYKNYMITDTYPDHNCRSKLYLVDLNNKKTVLLGSFLSFKQYRSIYRCDLHPRFNADNKSITFDSVCDGYRKVYNLDLSKIIK